MNLDRARKVADAVLYEGYLLYPYRAGSTKNRVRWQFGVLGPPGAAEAGVGEEPSMSMRCVLTNRPVQVVVHLRFLQLRRRQVYDARERAVEELRAGDTTWTSWDEAVEQEVTVSLALSQLLEGVTAPVAVAGAVEAERVTGPDGAPLGSVVHRRWPLAASITASVVPLGQHAGLDVAVVNTEPTRSQPLDKDAAIRSSLIGAHLLVEAHGAAFVSLLDPPEEAQAAVAKCEQRRCWPVLAGEPGDTDLVLGSPIILYDYPEVAPESAGALFDATEIDEILTLRVMTMTEQEKAEARATDPRAREVIDRCEQMTPEQMQRLHGVLRDPGPASGLDRLDQRDQRDGQPWWDPAADESVRPELDAVVVDGVSLSRGSLVRVRPRRRADAQDLFFAGKVAEVTAVLSDVDGGAHVALVLVDDPAADLHDWYGRYLYFAPDEVTPLTDEEADRVRAARGASAYDPAATDEPGREETRP